MRKHEDNLRKLLNLLVGDDGPATAIFLEFAAKYGIPISDGKVPLSTELNVMLQDWRVLILDPQKAGFSGAIGFNRFYDRLAAFALWPRVPEGAEKGYIMVGDKFPSIEILSGVSALSPQSTTDVLSTRIRFDRADITVYGTKEEKAFWKVLLEVVDRALELGSKFGYVQCDMRRLNRTS